MSADRKREEEAMFGTLSRELGQTLFLLALAATITAAYVGLGLVAIRFLG